MALQSIDLHFLKMAQSMASGTDDHSKRACIIAHGNRILSKSISQHLGGEFTKPYAGEKYVATVPAEIAAVGDCIKAGKPLTAVTIYTNSPPPWYVFKTMATFGFKRFVFYGQSDARLAHYAQELGISLVPVG
jgi:hypothetical protein